jgi:hypothetical protein
MYLKVLSRDLIYLERQKKNRKKKNIFNQIFLHPSRDSNRAHHECKCGVLREGKARGGSRVSWLKNALVSGGRGSIEVSETPRYDADITSFAKRKPERRSLSRNENVGRGRGKIKVARKLCALRTKKR